MNQKVVILTLSEVEWGGTPHLHLLLSVPLTPAPTPGVPHPSRLCEGWDVSPHPARSGFVHFFSTQKRSSFTPENRVMAQRRMSPMSKEQDWPDELDALNAAPHHHTLLFENEFVRVLDTRVPPGETVPLHTHHWPSAL